MSAEPDPYSYVDPELAAALKKFPPILDAPNAGNLASWRAGDSNNPSVSSAPALQPRKASIPGSGGAPEVNVLIFDPQPGTKDRPATLYIHGGGYIVGHAGTNLRMAQDIAESTQSPVVSVDYTLAPEAKFPVSLEQNYAALTWLSRNAGTLGADPARIAVMGDSAGGGHAAMLAIATRDRKEFKLAYQCLIYPMLDDRTGSTRHPPPPIGHFVWTEAANRFGWSSLLGVAAGSATVPAGSVPARVTDLSGLPPTFIGVGSIDLFVEEDMDYARRLAEAGVSTELFVIPGAYHGFDVVARDAKLTVQFRNAWQAALRRGLKLA
jgi:acetyl esterase/lipase